MFPLKVYYQLVLTDKNGKVIRRFRKRLSRSFVIQFLEMIDSLTNITGGIATITDISNNERTPVDTSVLSMNGGAGDVYRGIVVGTGTGAESNTNYCLGTQIAHGSAANQLNYGVQSIVPTQVVGANVDLVLSRVFTNNSGASITVTEIGVYAYITATSTQTGCIIRDLLAAGVAVGNGQQLTVSYTLRTTV